MSARTRFVCAGGEPLSVGSARLALVNWLLARAGGGTFVLRGDYCERLRFADCERLRRSASQWLAAVEMLRWLGLDWDQGPERPPGRDAECRHQAERLLELGRAYRCYCVVSPCQGICRDLPLARQQALQAAGRRPRLYLDGAAMSDGVEDVLLLDAAGLPGPLLARIVDDHLDGITVVADEMRLMREQPAELALYGALGWAAPRFVCLPALEPEVADRPLAEYREQGYGALPLANQLARLGWTPRGRRRLLSMSELAAQFSAHGMPRRPVAFDAEQLDWFNRRWLDGLDDEAHLALLRPHWWSAYGRPDRASGTTLAPAAWQRRLAATLRGQVHVPAEAAALARPLFVDRPAVDEDAARLLAQPWAGEVLRAFVEDLPAVAPFAFEHLDRWVSALRWRFKKEKGIRSRDVMHLLRGALTGQISGPCLIEDCLLLGRGRCMARASAALADWEKPHG